MRFSRTVRDRVDQRPGRRRARRAARRRHARRRRPGMPAGHHRNAARQLPGAVRTRRRALSTTGRRARWSPPSTRCRRRSSPPSTCTAIPATLTTPDAINRVVVGSWTRSTCEVMLRRRERVGRPRSTQTIAAINASPHKDRFRVARRHRLPQCRPGLGATRRSSSSRPTSRPARIGVGEVPQAVWPAHHQARWLAIEGRRSRARSAVGRVRAARRAGVHPHRRAAGVLPAAGQQERALARAVAVRRSPQQPARTGDVRAVDDRAQQHVPQASEDALRRRAFRVACQRSAAARRSCSTNSRT